MAKTVGMRTMAESLIAKSIQVREKAMLEAEGSGQRAQLLGRSAELYDLAHQILDTLENVRRTVGPMFV